LEHYRRHPGNWAWFGKSGFVDPMDKEVIAKTKCPQKPEWDPTRAAGMGTTEANGALVRKHALTGRHLFLDRDDSMQPKKTQTEFHDPSLSFNPITGEVAKYPEKSKRTDLRSFFSSQKSARKKYTGPMYGGPAWAWH